MPEIARIEKVNADKFCIEQATPIGRMGVIQNALILKYSPGCHDVPQQNDFGLFIYDQNGRAICIGYVEIDHQKKIDETQCPPLKPGDNIMCSRTPPGSEPENSLMVRMTEGAWEVKTPLNNGLEVAEGVGKITNDTQIIETQGGDLRVGNVMRPPVVGQPETQVLGPTGVLKEFFLNLYDKVTHIPRARVQLGDVISEYLPIPIPGPFGVLLRCLIQIYNILGLEVASFKVDDAGNVVLKAQLQAVIEAPKINLGSQASIQPYLLSVPWLTYFMSHTHTCTAPGTTSSPVLLPPNPASILSKKVFGE
jgi:hypothetical protein